MSRYTPPQRPQRFKSMDLASVTSQDCQRPYSKQTAKRDTCPVCEMDVFLHCGDCKIQITGCLCTAVERMTPEDFAQFKAEYEKRRLKEAGIWTPGQN